MDQHNALLHLSLLEGIGPATIKHAIIPLGLKHGWDALYHFTVADWMAAGITPRRAAALVEGLQHTELLERECALIQKHAITVITLLDSTYPAMLATIYIPPIILYMQGAPLTNRRHIAVVGSRGANRYGKEVIDALIPELVAHDMVIVSGGAIGADSMAHRATIAAGGSTIAVLGSGLLNPYPLSNKKLFHDITATGGTLISPFTMHTLPVPGNFPARNRVIAGMCQGVVIVQAAEKSGTRITAQYALEQGRDVFAVPGPLFDPLSAGCHALIQEGAKLVTCAHDILEEYALGGEKSSCSVIPMATAQREGTPLEQQILELCIHPHSIDELAIKVQQNIQTVQLLLFEMQMAGTLEQDFAGLWRTM
jgi:DNA processing protein